LWTPSLFAYEQRKLLALSQDLLVRERGFERPKSRGQFSNEGKRKGRARKERTGKETGDGRGVHLVEG
jgi:hypothetical protein